MQRLRLAWTLALIGFCMSASTVAIWGKIQLLFMLYFGAGFWMIEATAKADTTSDAPSEPDRGLRYSRFDPDASKTAKRPTRRRGAPSLEREEH